MKSIPVETTIRTIVRTAVETYATTFSERHLRELDDPDGTLNKYETIMSSLLTKENENPPVSPFSKGGLFTSPL